MIALGSDHGGFELKQEVKKYLEEQGIAYRDYGCDSEEAVDYPVYGKIVANAVASGECEKGILICGTGIGISITANKVKGIRCALCSDCFSAEATRLHNDANILAMGGRGDFKWTKIKNGRIIFPGTNILWGLPFSPECAPKTPVPRLEPAL